MPELVLSTRPIGNGDPFIGRSRLYHPFSAASSAASGQPVSFTAKLVATGAGVATPSGQVQFFTACACGLFGSLENRVLVGEAPLVNGAASITVTALPVGSTQVGSHVFR